MVPFRPDACADVVEQKVQICIHVLPLLPCRLTGKEKRVGGFDLMWNGGPVHRDDLIPATCGSSSFPSNTHLGNQKSLSWLCFSDSSVFINGCKSSSRQDA